jgi:hypothetical protein
MRILVNGAGVSLGKWARIQRNTIAFSDINIFCFDGCLVEDNNISSGRIGVSIKSGTVVRNSIFNNVLHGISGTSASLGELLVSAKIHWLEITKGMRSP